MPVVLEKLLVCKSEIGGGGDGGEEETRAVLAGGVSLWAVSPRVVFPPAVFGGCPPPVLLSRVAA